MEGSFGAMSYCAACGNQLPVGAVYCPACGLAAASPPGASLGPMQPIAQPSSPAPSHDKEGWQKSPVPLSSPQTSGLRLALSIIGLIGFGLTLVVITLAWVF